MGVLIALFIVLYIIIAVLVIMGYIFYKTRIKHEKVNLNYDYEDGDGYIFMIALFWPLSAVVFTFWLICHLIYTFFDWFAKSLEEEK